MSTKDLPLANLNVVPSCRVRVLVFSDENALPSWKTLADTVYTPRHINDVLKQHNLESANVLWLCGNETWYRGEQIATQHKPASKPNPGQLCAIPECCAPVSGKSKYCAHHKKIAREKWLEMIADKKQQKPAESPAKTAQKPAAKPAKKAATARSKKPAKKTDPLKEARKERDRMQTTHKTTWNQFQLLDLLQRNPGGLPYERIKHQGSMVIASVMAATKRYVSKDEAGLYTLTERGLTAHRWSRWNKANAF